MVDEYNYPEDFLMDDTFKQYCEGSNEKCVVFWEKWIAEHPEKRKTVYAAKKLYQLLSGNLKPVNQQVEYLNRHLNPEIKPKRFRTVHYAIAASILLLLFAGLMYTLYQRQGNMLPYAKKIVAKRGEKKKITLSDGTLVYLNADSKIELGDDFNQKERSVKLSGEAYFDVKHDASKPFFVQTKDFKISVLGTAFNVKSYTNEDESAATLVRGTIKLEDNTGLNKNTVILKAGQKITYHLLKALTNPRLPAMDAAERLPKIEVNNLTLLNKEVVESAWTNNNLIFANDNFGDIKARLERWFNVTIEFEDKELAGYTYTGHFENEDLITILNTLKKVKRFNFKQKGEHITITK
ncbi:FecR family protein [Pedobacter sp. GSP4]|uniref:FecR family protein n=1 Tax=Pedobacter sp. GSP4 TaxID=3453716 RepID=UPI003EE8EF6C